MPFADRQRAKEYQKKWNEENKDRVSLLKKEYKLKHKERLKAINDLYQKEYNKLHKDDKTEYDNKNKLRVAAKKYDVTVEFLQELINKSNNKCEICRKERKLCVDHDHKTGKVRSMICRKCNSALGMIEDDPQIALSLSSYIQKYLG